MTDQPEILHLHDGVVSVVVVVDGMPAIVYWGAFLGGGPIDARHFERPVAGGGLDHDVPMGVVPEAAVGWAGRPGLEGSRPDGSAGQPVFRRTDLHHDERSMRVALRDDHAGLVMAIRLSLSVGSVLTLAAELTNVGAEPYRLDACRICLPVGDTAGEVLTFGGRHNNEFAQHRSTWGRQVIAVENRRGRTSHDRSPTMVVGTPGFANEHGEVWAVHLGWSGDYEMVADAVTDGRHAIQVGEVLRSGEVVLEPGAMYRTPTVFAARSAAGLVGISDAFHTHIRSRPGHPTKPRPVHLNTWEAVYFDQSLDRLRSLADRAAQVGVERFVLDDGWFGSRRDDRSGLGDWTVSSDVWPSGLGPLIEHVRSLGLGFGLWVEPEMVNPDSDLFRAHPEWVLGDHRYEHVLGRHQLVLDLGRADVREHLFSAIDALLRDHDIEYLKWDHNRDLVQAASGHGSGVHAQTLGVYELIDRIRAAHPGVEIESCASGGGRADLGILARTDRVWVSDTMDPLDRHGIHSGFSILFPPELMGAHVGAPITHTTLRRHRHGFRAAAALFGSFGLEWDLLRLDDDGLDVVGQLVALHRRHRSMLHSGRTIRVDHPDATLDVHGVVASDRSEALFVVSRLASSHTHHTAPIRFPGLDPDVDYNVSVVGDLGEPLGWARQQPSWLADGIRASGRRLSTIGVRAPVLHPESSMLCHLEAQR